MNEYRYSKYLYKPKKKKKKLYLAIFLLILAGGVIFYGLTLDIYKIYSNIVSIYRVWFNDYRFIEKNLDNGDYNVVIHEGTPYLEKRPYNAKLMRYIGEAYYYISKSLTGEEKEESISKAIFLIRKGIVLSQFDEAITKNYFLLGMAYFDKGPLYYELAAEYLAKALEYGYNDNNIYEILGYSYYKLGVLKKAIDYLEKAKVMTPKDIVYLFLAFAYKNSGMYESAIKELDHLVDTTSDDAVLEESFAARAWIDFQEERYVQARENLIKVLSINQNSAYAHYWMGNIYEKQGDLISARKEWRIVLKIDSKHIGSIEKLY
ncbi:MAG TPA: tetratricopeptide repeat protein [Spirochaetes bacterium]|nr:tetratricopeptide repeat protein [Spirochaetota bacterium]